MLGGGTGTLQQGMQQPQPVPPGPAAVRVQQYTFPQPGDPYTSLKCVACA